MKTYLVAFDLHHPPQNYMPLNDQLRSLKFEPLMSHVWTGACEVSATSLKQRLCDRVQRDDSVLVVEGTIDDLVGYNLR